MGCVLVVADDREIVDVLGHVVEEIGDVGCVVGGNESALRASGELGRRDVVAVVLYASGDLTRDLALVAELVSRRPALPVVYLGTGPNTDARVVLEAGAMAYLPAPCDAANLGVLVGALASATMAV